MNDPAEAGAAHRLGSTLYREGRVNEAAEALGRAVRLAPKQPRYRISLAAALGRLGRDAEAVAQLQTAMIHGGGGLPELHNNLGAVPESKVLLTAPAEAAASVCRRLARLGLPSERIVLHDETCTFDTSTVDNHIVRRGYSAEKVPLLIGGNVELIEREPEIVQQRQPFPLADVHPLMDLGQIAALISLRALCQKVEEFGPIQFNVAASIRGHRMNMTVALALKVDARVGDRPVDEVIGNGIDGGAPAKAVVERRFARRTDRLVTKLGRLARRPATRHHDITKGQKHTTN